MSTPGEDTTASGPSAALQEALALRSAAERSGTVRRRRRADIEADVEDDVEDDGPPPAAEGPSAPAPGALGWPDVDEPTVHTPSAATPGGLGWPSTATATATVPTAVPTAVPTVAPAVVPVPLPGPPGVTRPATVIPPAPLPTAAPARTASPPPSAVSPPSAIGSDLRPDSGWRRWLHLLTGGLVNAGETPQQRRRRELEAQISGSTAGCHRIAVISLKGGVGKTTMSVCLGAVLASIRTDRVIAVDANPDRGTLSGKVTPQTGATVRDLLEGIDDIASYGDIRRFTSQSPDRLEILVSSADPAQSDAFGEQDYRRVVHALEDYYSVVVTDCGTGLLHSAMTGVLDLADQLVVVSTNSVDGANSASATLDWLQAHGHADLVSGAVAVVNAVVPGSGNVDQERLVAHFAGRCRAVVRIPHDEHLEAGAEVELAALSRPTRDALLAFAAEVVTVIPPVGRA